MYARLLCISFRQLASVDNLSVGQFKHKMVVSSDVRINNTYAVFTFTARLALWPILALRPDKPLRPNGANVTLLPFISLYAAITLLSAL